MTRVKRSRKLVKSTNNRKRLQIKTIDVEKVKRIMEEKGINEEMFAEKANFSLPYAQRFLRGENNQRLFFAHAPFLIALVLDTQVNRILTDEFMREYKVRKPPKSKK